MNMRMLWLILSVLLFGCWLPRMETESNPNVKIIVPASENVPNWMLSPGGEKIIYASIKENATFLLYPETQERKKFNFCTPAFWLDSINVLCKIDSSSPFILITDDFTQLPLHRIEIRPENLDKLNNMLSQAIHIYKYEGDYQTQFTIDKKEIYLLSENYKENLGENYLVSVENVDEVLKNYDYDYTIIPQQQSTVLSGEKQSPNGDYYYILKNNVLTIYDMEIDEIVVEYDYLGQGYLETGGWAGDSSGVYFQRGHGGGLTPMEPGAIMKLNIPQ